MRRRGLTLCGESADAPRQNSRDSGSLTDNYAMRVVSIVNQKGGCGKTTTAINLAATLAADGARVLLVDMDPQSHCAAGLGVPDQTVECTIADAMVADLTSPPRSADFLWEVGQGLKLIPSSVGLAALEAPNGPLAARFDRDRRLARVLGAWQAEFDWCIIDCPPTIGLLTFNALRAADLVLIPVETGYFSLKGAERQIDTIQSIVRRFGRDIPFRLLPTLYNDARPLARDVVATLTKRFPDALLPLYIREHEALRDAVSYGQSICEFAPGSEAENDFIRLAEWLKSNAPAAHALSDFSGADAPAIEINEAGIRSFVDNADGSLGSSTTARMASAAEHPTDRAADLASRLRALNERNRQAASAGGGFGVRINRDGIAVFAQPASACALFVVGDFNDWNPVATPLAASSDGLRMEATIALPVGRHAYRIVCDGLEVIDTHNTHRQGSSDGADVNLVEVPLVTANSSAPRHAHSASEGGSR